MADWQTMIAAIAADKGGGRAAVKDQDSIKRCIVDAIRKISLEDHFWIQETEVEFATTANTLSYDLTAVTDLVAGRRVVGFVGKHIWYMEQVGAVWERQYSIEQVSHAEMEGYRIGTPSYDVPIVWCVRGNLLELWPGTPDTTHRIRGNAITHPGSPLYQYDGANWDFFEPDGVTALTGAFTNEWFVEGYQMVRSYATFLLCNGYWRGETTRTDAEAALGAYAIHRQALKAATRRRTAPLDITPINLAAYG